MMFTLICSQSTLCKLLLFHPIVWILIKVLSKDRYALENALLSSKACRICSYLELDKVVKHVETQIQSI